MTLAHPDSSHNPVLTLNVGRIIPDGRRARYNQMCFPIWFVQLQLQLRRQRYESLTAELVGKSSTRKALFEFAECIDQVAQCIRFLSPAVR